jgi:hypothetical protein
VQQILEKESVYKSSFRYNYTPSHQVGFSENLFHTRVGSGRKLKGEEKRKREIFSRGVDW